MAVLLAVFINLLDSCTFGVILFPPGFGQYATVGVSSFLFSTVISQLVFTAGSGFNCIMGTAMVRAGYGSGSLNAALHRLLPFISPFLLLV